MASRLIVMRHGLITLILTYCGHTADKPNQCNIRDRTFFPHTTHRTKRVISHDRTTLRLVAGAVCYFFGRLYPYLTKEVAIIIHGQGGSFLYSPNNNNDGLVQPIANWANGTILPTPRIPCLLRSSFLAFFIPHPPPSTYTPLRPHCHIGKHRW